MDFTILSQLTQRIKPKCSQVCCFMYVVDLTKREHCLQLFCQPCHSCLAHLKFMNYRNTNSLIIFDERFKNILYNIVFWSYVVLQKLLILITFSIKYDYFSLVNKTGWNSTTGSNRARRSYTLSTVQSLLLISENNTTKLVSLVVQLNIQGVTLTPKESPQRFPQ